MDLGFLVRSEGFTPNGDIFPLGALGNGVGSGIGGSSSAVVAVRCQKVVFPKINSLSALIKVALVVFPKNSSLSARFDGKFAE